MSDHGNILRNTSKEALMPKNPRPPIAHPALDTIALTTLLHALSDPTRFGIVETLFSEGSDRACGTFPVEVAPSTLSHHFRVLRESGLIRQEDRGNQRWTSLRAIEIEQRFPGVLDALMNVPVGLVRS
jgi:DNA-binding transcriptional ArsR family regulator